MLDGRLAHARQLTTWFFAERLIDLRSRGGAASALFAPTAMLLGGLGLLTLWNLSPATLPTGDPGPTLDALRVFERGTPIAPSVAGPQREAAVIKAAQANASALTSVLTRLGAPLKGAGSPTAPPATLNAVRDTEEQAIRSADAYARSRVDRLRQTFHAVGVDVRSLPASGGDSGLSALELSSSRVLAARFDIDEPMARHVERTSQSLMALRTMAQSASILPFSVPVDDPVKSSSFGMRIDPFTKLPAFHPGQDFAGRFGQEIHATAPGVIAFAGPRSGYGNCIEVDHGHGFKTRYGHLEQINVSLGQTIALGQTIGLMGSTGRSTGVHLHYEVWRKGKLEDPAPYLKAGEDLQRALGNPVVSIRSLAPSIPLRSVQAPVTIAQVPHGHVAAASGRVVVRFAG